MVDSETSRYLVLDWEILSKRDLKEDFIDSMRRIAQRSNLNRDDPMWLDQESAHVMADELMCHVLIDLGFGEGVDIFRNMPKWYA